MTTLDNDQKNNIELLSPAGDMERLRAAINFGADAVYLGGKRFGMRTSSSNFTMCELEKACKMCHSKGIKVYLTCNTLPQNNEIDELPEFLLNAASAGVDAFIISDLGVLSIAKKVAPQVDVHASTQTGVVNYMTARYLWELGAKRIVLARELSLSEIATIRAKTDPKLELEAFVHGAMCVSFSGRCLISSYLTGRDANRGNCSQPCRWKYSLMEEKREGEYFPIMENRSGTYFFNSKDMCMIEHVPELIKAGITSMKIEGRAKSAYYVAVTTNAYKHALNGFMSSKDYKLEPWIKEEVYKVSHRKYSTGFYFGHEPGQFYESGGYEQKSMVVAVCEDYQNGMAQISQRNKFFEGDNLEVLEPKSKPFKIKVEKIFDEFGNRVKSTPHPAQKLFIPTTVPIKPNAFIRKITKY